jgi:hypothetical protein
MSTDPDRVRIDLLVCKRKLYISYPEGSAQRQEFLFASKLTELTYLQKLVNPDIVNAVFGEYHKRLRLEVLNIVISIVFGFCLSVTLFGYHQAHLAITWLSFYKLPFFFGMFSAGTHTYHLIKHWQQFQPFKDEYATLKVKIEKLINEIKGLAK